MLASNWGGVLRLENPSAFSSLVVRNPDPLVSPHTSCALVPSYLSWCFSGFPPTCQDFLTLLSPNPDIPLPTCLGLREQITISLNVLALILKLYVGKPSLLQTHCWLVFNLFSMRTSISCSAKLLSSKPAPKLCFTWAYSALHSLGLAKISALCGSLFLQHVEIPLKTSPALHPASCSFLLGLNLVLAHWCQTPSHYLQENT